MIRRLTSDFWFYAIAGLILALAGWIVYVSSANAASVFRTDPFVRLIERTITGNTGLSIGPGTKITLTQCQCTVEYLGTKIQGHTYMVYLDKLD
jgi:hypothetical protein